MKEIQMPATHHHRHHQVLQMLLLPHLRTSDVHRSSAQTRTVHQEELEEYLELVWHLGQRTSDRERTRAISNA